ncbi:MAG: sialidase family protein [Verrucomicrobiota bacterium]
MKSILIFYAVTLTAFSSAGLRAADLPPEFVAAEEKARAAIPLGGDFQPDPKVPVFVAVGHGGRIVLSRDDGESWDQVYFGHLGSDHSPWATKAIAYTDGVFVVPIGWGAPAMWIASEDGVNWRHLTNGETTLEGVKGADENPAIMAGTWGIAGGAGTFVSGGYMTMSATPDLGKSFTTFSLRQFKDDPRPRDLVTHHVGPVWCGDSSGRFLALGNDRSKKDPVFGNLWASDDLGETWNWLEPTLLNEKCEGYSGIACNGTLVVIADKSGANVFVSADAGETWEGPSPTGLDRATMSLVGDEFWIVSARGSRATKDGKDWRELPEGIPRGKIVSSPDGALVNIERRRCSLLRSGDGGASWDEVYSFEEPKNEHIHGAQGFRDLAFGYVAEESGK